MIGVSIIGHGYWGPNLVRNFSEAPGWRVVSVADLRRERLAPIASRYPAVKVTVDYREAIEDRSVEAVAIATPVTTHYDLAMMALRAGKHVLITKPLASTAHQAAELVEEADRRRLVLLVDHTFLYTGAVGKIRDLLVGQELGDIYYYDSVRVNLGLFQPDVNVIWDLAVHDLAILDFVLPVRPRAVSATGLSHVEGRPENIAFLTLYFDQRFIAHVNVNWLAPVKVRRTLIGGSRKMVVYDDLEPSEKIKVYESGITVSPDKEDVYRILIDYRTGDMWAPQLPRVEALQVEVRDFLECIKTSRRPASDAETGLRVVRLLEAATTSMARRGAPVDLSQD